MRNIRTLSTALVALGMAAAPQAAAQEARTPEQVIESATADYVARDFNGFIAHFADDAVVEANGLSFQGRTRIREAYRLNFAPDAPRIRVVEREAYEDRVIDLVEYRLNGETWCCTQTAYIIENGRIVYANVM